MAIFVPPLMDPLVWTRRNYEAWMRHHNASMDFIQAYRDTLSIFGMFSIKKNRRVKETQQALHKARDNYYAILKEEGF